MIRRTTLAKASVALAAATALTASLSACGSGHRATPRSVTATANRPGAASSSAPAPGALTGLLLRSALPTLTDVAAGITVSGVYDTGTDFTAPHDLPKPSLPDADCTAAPSIDADALTADYRAAYASEELDNAGNSLHLVVAATNPGDAAKQLTEIRDFAQRCANFAAPDPTGQSVGGTVTIDSLTKLGDEALRIRVTATGPDAASYAQPEVILVRVGDEIVAVSDADHDHDGAAALSAADLLLQRLQGQPA
ncbi:hypothetical protein [Catenulispora rubra]|uniref:hypothetical protein n=1 Tax=Catenulispora rubra TaxID=280293 RepID=UPI0018926FEB|nr:hypothetical protein [Catenulispora rubra]